MTLTLAPVLATRIHNRTRVRDPEGPRTERLRHTHVDPWADLLAPYRAVLSEKLARLVRLEESRWNLLFRGRSAASSIVAIRAARERRLRRKAAHRPLRAHRQACGVAPVAGPGVALEGPAEL